MRAGVAVATSALAVAALVGGGAYALTASQSVSNRTAASTVTAAVVVPLAPRTPRILDPELLALMQPTQRALPPEWPESRVEVTAEPTPEPALEPTPEPAVVVAPVATRAPTQTPTASPTQAAPRAATVAPTVARTAVPAAATLAAPAGGVHAAIQASFGSQYAIALRVATCESGLNPNATGRAGERGLFQIHPVHANGLVRQLGYTWDQMYQIGPNIAVAAHLQRSSGWGPWSCAR